MKLKNAAVLILVLCVMGGGIEGAPILSDHTGKPIYPIGFYELPKDDEELERMAKAGVNLVRCHSAEDLDRAQSVGMQGVYPISVQKGADESLREEIQSVKDHPALAIWEGPDEVIWNFTAFSGLHRTMGIYPTRNEWKDQTQVALDYSNQKAAEIIPKMVDGIELLKSLDERDRPFWINEAWTSDARFVREYLDAIEITGCDIYPVNDRDRRLLRVTEGVERWKKIGRDKPVFMVLQAFSWDELGEYHGAGRARTYPTFEESRFMAYSSLAHGADGILYWGSNYLQSDEMRESIYSLTRELSNLQPYLVSTDHPGVAVDLLELPERAEGFGVQCLVRKVGEAWLIILVNEDEIRHMGVEVTGLDELNGRELHLLYGKETLEVNRGEVIFRMQPFEVKVYSTTSALESEDLRGRSFGMER